MRLVFEIVDNVARESRAFPVGPVVGQVSNSRTNAGDEGKEGCTFVPPLWVVVAEKSGCEVAISYRGRSPGLAGETFHNWLRSGLVFFACWTRRSSRRSHALLRCSCCGCR